MPDNLAEFLAMELDLDYGLDVYRIRGLIEQYDLFTIPDSPNELDANLRYPAWRPATHPRLKPPHKHKRKHGYQTAAQMTSKWKGVPSIFSIIR